MQLTPITPASTTTPAWGPERAFAYAATAFDDAAEALATTPPTLPAWLVVANRASSGASALKSVRGEVETTGQRAALDQAFAAGIAAFTTAMTGVTAEPFQPVAASIVSARVQDLLAGAAALRAEFPPTA